ncbi:MAG TPA: isocitrate/isopropylmalate family dehydrogenase [Terriglobales bacterium]|nr:isocitrate/isopropylmalate family dehydrogenase [Terriglobales bacterium]
MQDVTLLHGDGIGPEVIAATLKVLDAAGAQIRWHDFKAGQEAVDAGNDFLPKAMLESIAETGVCLKGPITTPIGGGFPSVNVALRKRFDLYANLRPVYNLPNVPSRFQDVDLVVVRENTEGLYSGIEHEVVPGVVESLKIASEKACRRIAHFAFEYARRHGRKRVHAIHKANIMKLTDGLFLRCAREAAQEYPDIQYGEAIVDNACMQLVMKPHQFDVLVLENLYGDILSDLCAGLVGGLGLVAGANLGEKHAIFEAVHGSAPDIAGRGVANPTAVMMAAEMLLRHIQQPEAAERLRQALLAVYRAGEHLTRDVGGTANTAEFTEAVLRALPQ